MHDLALSKVVAAAIRPELAAAPESSADADALLAILGPDALADLDPFDRVQLLEVIRVCRASESLSAAGRTLFASSRQRKRSSNDGDRLRKYLARFNLTWASIQE